MDNLQLYRPQVISRGNLYPDVIHLKISAYIKNGIKQGNLKVVSPESKQDLILNALQKMDPRLVKLKGSTDKLKTCWHNVQLRTRDFHLEGGKLVTEQCCDGGEWDQQTRTATHGALLRESKFILANALFHHHRMGKWNSTCSDQPIDCIIVKKWRKLELSS